MKADNLELLKKLKGGEKRKVFERNLKDIQYQMSTKKRKQGKLNDMVQRHRRNQTVLEQLIESEKEELMMKSHFGGFGGEPSTLYDPQASKLAPSTEHKSMNSKIRAHTQF